MVVVFLASWPWVKARLQAVAVLKTLSHEPIPLPVRAVTASNVLTQDVAIPTANGTLRGRLYSPAGVSGAPGMVIVHGVHHLGMNEPRLELFASAMASCGLQVLTPELPAIADYRIGPESVSAIGESARWFAQQTGGKVSVLGLSFSGGLALLAAEQPAYATEMKMVFAIGSQANMQRVARYYRTGRDIRPDGSVQVLAAHEYGPLVMEYEHMEDFASAADRVALSSVLKEHLYEDGAGEPGAGRRFGESVDLACRDGEVTRGGRCVAAGKFYRQDDATSGAVDSEEKGNGNDDRDGVDRAAGD